MPGVFVVNKIRINQFDNNAVLELPHKLMITAIILAMVLPVIVESVQTFTVQNQERALEAECRYLTDSVKSIYSQGLHSTRIIDLELPDKTVKLEAGADIRSRYSTDIFTVRYKVEGGEARRMTVRNGHSYISMSSENQGALEITSGGEYKIRLIKRETNIDLNSDGIVPDYYISLSII